MTDTFGNCSTRSCWKRARAAAPSGPLQRRDERLRRLLEHARAEHEHEAAVARVAPLDVADARHARRDDPAEDVEAHRVADVEPRRDRAMLFSIDTSASADGPFQNAPCDHALVRLEMVAIRDRVLAADRAPRAPHVLRRRRALVSLPRHADDPRAQHRDQLKLARRRAPGRRETRARRRPAPAGCRSGTCRARRPTPAARTRSSRLACSDRTPTMKNAPRPTASRITRVWLPGRDRCSTACRSGNDRELRQRRDRARSARGRPGAGRPPAPANPTHTTMPDLERRRLPGRQRRRAPADTATVTPMPRPVARAPAPSRRAAAATA